MEKNFESNAIHFFLLVLTSVYVPWLLVMPLKRLKDIESIYDILVLVVFSFQGGNMKPFSSLLGAVSGVTCVLTLMFFTLSCSEVKFQSRKNAEASCVGNGCATPYTYAWAEGGFGTCSVPCGGGVQTQTVTCQRSDGVTVEESNCTNSGTKPSASRSCNIQACTSTYTWNIGAWGVCSKSCGSGTQSRTVVCQTDTGTTVADGYCSNPKPGTSQACNTQSCPPQYTYGWQLVPGQCSETCGGGWEKFICKRNDNTTVAESYCTDPKPQVACNTHACPIQYTYSWTTGSWGVCSKSCGGGVRTRDVVCKRNDGQAMADIYCSGQSQPASQEACNTQSCPNTGRDVTTTMTLPLPAVDVIMIVDDSSSMAADNAKLAQRMSGFLNDLDAAKIDYRVCLTTTDVSFYKGSPIKWGYYSGSNFVTGSHLMTRSTPNKAKLFTDTIKQIGAEWSSDEQGIKALYMMIDDFSGSGCLRSKSTLTTILISDENERSVGGNQSWSSAQYQPLTSKNYPDNLISRVAQKYNASNYVKPFIWNSIIVKPGDTQCEAIQDSQGVPSFFGTLYNELSNKTGGHVGSICQSDYAQSLTYVKNRVVQSMPYVELECVPSNTPTITISPNTSTSISMDGSRVRFNPALPEGTTVTAKYRCPN